LPCYLPSMAVYTVFGKISAAPCLIYFGTATDGGSVDFAGASYRPDSLTDLIKHTSLSVFLRNIRAMTTKKPSLPLCLF
jgi:hypothetical protein